ncbi:tetratricopeptide repeat protein [Aquimarina spongiae]|uniref:Tfp pilus assembly protein PilF n=1 Tax=Aquimarina spongiae TaxID=570521 RepID=A0A1M6J092_9FLAO|nr:tetratricopeptide repeat protein [Aquimarina spongiae]SHJ40042.1 Tfp pilus assembly protein PilF [Aquimarina spongiae]
MNFFRVSCLFEKLIPAKKTSIYLVLAALFGLWSTSSFAKLQKIDSLLHQLNVHEKEDIQKVDLLNTIGYEYWIMDANESINFGTKALQLSQQLNYRNGEARANRVVGVAYWAQGDLNMALQYLNASHKIYQEIEDKTGLANTRLNIGMVYADLKEYKKAKYYYKQAINEFTALGLKSRIATTFTKIGTMLVEQGQDTEALRYLTDALQMHTDSNFTYGIAEAHGKLGMLYLHKNEIEQAYYHVKRSMELGSIVSDTDGLTNNLILHGKILRLSGRLEESAAELNKGLQLAKENGLKKYELLAYEELKELKKQHGNPEEVYEFYEQYIILRDSLFNLEKSKQIAYMEFENELEKRDKALESLKAQEKKDRLIQYLLLMGTFILAIGGTFIFVIYKQRAQKSKQLVTKNQELLESAFELSQKKLENAELKQQELKQQLDFKNKELSSYTLNFIKKNEIVQQIQQTIQHIRKSSSVEKNKLIADLNKIVKKNMSIDKDWEDFSRFFEDAHQGFYTQLKSTHPDLSTNDLKICSLIRLNLNVKEMASILGISPDSARTARYRLRKKMKLTPEQEILSYLIQLENEKVV